MRKPRDLTIIIPARNEEHNIKACLDSLLHQTIENFYIIVVDDNSDDHTSEIVKSYAREYSYISLIKLTEKPSGWVGKNYALYEGACQVSTPYILFLDADVKLAEYCVEFTYNDIKDNNYDLISYAAFQECEGFLECAVQPLVFYILNVVYPFNKVNQDNNQIAACNGIFIFIKNDTYKSIGTHEAVKSEILEDVKLAQLIKENGQKLKFYYAPDLLRVRMYRHFNELYEGWSKNFFALLQYNYFKAILIVFLLLFIFWVPVIAMFLDPALVNFFIPLLLLVIIHFGYVYYKMDYSFLTGLLFPVGSLLVSAIIIQSIINYNIKGQVKWKGRTYTVK
jgi:chlorobactene glucosyltransferase